MITLERTTGDLVYVRKDFILSVKDCGKHTEITMVKRRQTDIINVKQTLTQVMDALYASKQPYHTDFKIE